MIKIEALHDHVLIKPEKKTTVTESGIHIPDTTAADRRGPACGTVIKVGPGKQNAKGELVPVPVSPGDLVYYMQGQLQTVKLGGESFVMVPSPEILLRVVQVE